MSYSFARRLAGAAAACLAVAAAWAVEGQPQVDQARPGARVVVDAHNAYPYNGRFVDRIDRALATGLPIAVEQDLVWRPAANGRPARSIVSHGEPFDDTEPSLRDHFFERIRPLVEQALVDGDRSRWPIITLNLDLKTNEPDHHRALWDLLGDHEAWLTTAVRTADPRTPSPLEVKPVLVLTGESDAQAAAFHDQIPVGGKLRLFGAMPIRPRSVPEAARAAEQSRFWQALPTVELPAATNYRRWWNAPWQVVEAGGQREAGEWTAEEDARLRTLVRRAHDAGLWVRLWTINGQPRGEEKASGWSAGYNVGSLEQARERWRAAIAAGVDYIATDQFPELAAALAADPVRTAGSSEVVIEGELTPADRLTWIERAFEVPRGTGRIDVAVSYTDRDRGTAIEFGLFDPERLRGASRTSKSAFFVSRTAATPSYQPGALQAGTWRLLMGVPSIRDGVTSLYRAVVRLTPEALSDRRPPLEVIGETAPGGSRGIRGICTRTPCTATASRAPTAAATTSRAPRTRSRPPLNAGGSTSWR